MPTRRTARNFHILHVTVVHQIFSTILFLCLGKTTNSQDRSRQYHTVGVSVIIIFSWNLYRMTSRLTTLLSKFFRSYFVKEVRAGHALFWSLCLCFALLPLCFALPRLYFHTSSFFLCLCVNIYIYTLKRYMYIYIYLFLYI
jgi:hypothetical protein